MNQYTSKIFRPTALAIALAAMLGAVPIYASAIQYAIPVVSSDPSNPKTLNDGDSVTIANAITGALHVLTGGIINASGSITLVTNNTQDYGAWSLNDGSINLDSVTITNYESGSYGLYAKGTASTGPATAIINIAGTDLLVSKKDNSAGVYADGINTVINLNGALTTDTTNYIVANGAHVFGIYAGNGGVVNVNGTSGSSSIYTTLIDTSQSIADTSVGVQATGPNSLVNFNGNVNILTGGNDSSAVVASTGGKVIFQDQVNIDTTSSGNNTYGAHAKGVNANIVFNKGVVIKNSGVDSYGIYASSDDSSPNAPSIKVVGDSYISTIGNSIRKYGVYAQDGGAITLENTQVVTQGDSSIGLFSSTPVSAAQVSSITINGNLNVDTTGCTTDCTAAVGTHKNGIQSTGNKALIELKGSSNIIKTGGDYSYGISVSEAGRVDITGAAPASGWTTFIDTSAENNTAGSLAYSNNSIGVFSSDANSMVNFNGSLSIKTAGDASFGIDAESAGEVDVGGDLYVDNATEPGDHTSGVVSNGNGSKIILAGKSNIIKAQGESSFGIYANGGGVVNVIASDSYTDIDTSFGGNHNFGVYASGASSIVSLAGAVKAVTGGDHSTGLIADTGGQILISGDADIDTTKPGDYTIGIDAENANSIVDVTGKATIDTDGIESDGISAVNNGFVNISGVATINTHGISSNGVYVSGGNSKVTLGSGGSITTQKSNSHDISLTYGATDFADSTTGLLGTAPNSLKLLVTGADSSVLHVSGGSGTLAASTWQSSSITLGDSFALDMSMTNNAIGCGASCTWGAKAETGGIISFNGTASSGGTGLWVIGTGSSQDTVATINLNVTNPDAISGSRVRVDDYGVLNIGNAVNIGSLQSASANTLGKVDIHDNTLGIGAGLIGTQTIDSDSTYAGLLTGSVLSHLVKTGATIQRLTGIMSSVGNVEVTGGTLSFEQNGEFNVSGNAYTTRANATTNIGLASSTLTVNSGVFTQDAGSNLIVTIGASPDISADTAQLDGSLTINGFDALTIPTSATDIASHEYTVIHTNNGINGDFASSSYNPNTGLDYLLQNGHVSANGKDYDLGFQLAWTDGKQVAGTGNFTVNAGTAFDVDVILADQTGTFNSGWNGKDLSKMGDGTLVLSANNTYHGATTLNGGILKASADNNLENSSDIIVNAGTLDLSLSNIQTANRLSGTGGVIDLGNAALTLQNAAAGIDDTSFSGKIIGAGNLIKVGAASLTLDGIGSSVGDVTVNEGALNFAQSGLFAVNGNYITSGGATTALTQTDTGLSVSGAFTQKQAATLNVVIGASPDITADSATLDGAIVINGFASSATPYKASELMDNPYTVIKTSSGITGDFSSQSTGQASSLDYLLINGYVSPDTKDYDLSFRLAWNSGGKLLGTGNFTIDAGSIFELDVALADQTGTFDSHWNGEDLTKLGAGTLILSNKNEYKGKTTIEDGVLQTNFKDVFAKSSDVIINAGILNLNGFAQTANRLSGSDKGAIHLAGANLTVNNSFAGVDDTTFAGEISGNGNLIKTGAGALTLTGKTAWVGETDINAGSLILDGTNGGGHLDGNVVGQDHTHFILQNGAAFSGKVDPVIMNVGANSSWNMTASSVVDSLSVAGTVIYVFNSTVPNKTLTVNGDFVGEGGLIEINTTLADDNSPTARLMITGNSVGNAKIHVNNINGAGAATTDGIKIVHVAGASNARFDLAGRDVAGAYEYLLYQGTLTGNDGDWYLRSSAGMPTPVPNYRPEGGEYLANQIADNSLFVHTLHERLGETMYESDVPGCNNLNGSVWARVSGNTQGFEAADGQIDTSSNNSLVQAGVDLIKWHDNKSRIQAGVMFAGGQSNSTSHAKYNSARSDGKVNAYAFGVYATWYGEGNAQNEGPYVDSWLQYGHYNNSVKGDDLPEQKYDSHNWLASLEAGYAIALSKNPHNIWYFEPQAQVVYAAYSQNDVTEDNGTEVNAENTNSFTTRLGARLYARSALKNGMKLKPFAEVNWLHNQNIAAVSMDNTLVNSDYPSDRAEVKLGLEAELAKNWNVWGHVGYQQGSHGYRQTGGNIGVKYLW